MIKVLLIDDDPINNFVNKKLIQKLNQNYEIEEFLNATDALEYLKTNTPELIFLDLAMPEMDGWEFLDKYTASNYKAPIFILTTSIDPRDRKNAEKFKAVSGFFVKPLTIKETELIIP